MSILKNDGAQCMQLDTIIPLFPLKKGPPLQNKLKVKLKKVRLEMVVPKGPPLQNKLKVKLKKSDWRW